MRVRLFNAKYSPNLGDGLLSECLEKALIENGCSHSGTYSIDVAGRTEYTPGGTSRSSVLRLLHIMPAKIRRLLLKLPLAVAAKFKWKPHYRAHLENADAVVIGGGNLFADLDLNFPTKLSLLLDEAKRRRLPVLIYGVGVSSTWSDKGVNMLRNSMKGSHIPYVAVRDHDSKENFDKRFGTTLGREAIVVRDPGLLISRFVGGLSQTDHVRTVIGLCVTGAVAVRYHSTYQIEDSYLEAWYSSLYNEMTRAGYAVQLFTNGSPEDVEAAKRVVRRLALDGVSPNLKPCLRPNDPSELAALISTCALVIGFRMHALIAAYSYGREIIALRWDRKLDSFMTSVGLGDWIVWPGDTSPQMVVDRANELLLEKKNLDGIAVVEAFEDAANLSKEIQALKK
ncbi:polysaccharide pyruvyl transferase family protein [Agrobacterium tumefaciens]|uniref:polysaccharide pyruvyl transferase family protein n=1 Tax=Agrobacterium tumefaciens TaxID=358 RepID=UPI0021D0C4F2|nr:polysaccharide pyruvyl transferase family protein [Agrobacterium tumefaciens]UXS05112.1 polysaccharide pyruvyl transferase family protein [Agrobacterium tumefaciens]